VATFVRHGVAQLRNLLVFVTTAILLVLLASSSYLVQPQHLFLLFNWGLFLTLTMTTLAVLVQMDRDPVLSYMSGQAPGRFSWDRAALGRIVTYVVLPVVGLLLSDVPQLKALIGQAVEGMVQIVH
jgi:hypothetical protein